MTVTSLHVLGLLAVLVLGALLFAVLFEPGLQYTIRSELPRSDSREARGLIAALVDAAIMDCGDVQVLTNGAIFYERELAAIQRARHSIHLEAYIFHRSAIADRFLKALEERAKAGVRVRVVIDAIGSMWTPDGYFSSLRNAGGQVMWYQPVRWANLKRFNNRTHRELLVVDGETAFIGGAGVAAWWDTGVGSALPWRDTVLSLRGPLASALQTTFAENWLESTGEVLARIEDFQASGSPVEQLSSVPAKGLVVISTPSAGKATRARILFQLLLASARVSIRISSPYFLPDLGVLRELGNAVARGVDVQVIVPGGLNNHPIARRASRRRYGTLLRAGVGLHEYQGAMMHAKILIVDGVWSVVGSTNFDNRSFGLNDEVNLAVQGAPLAQRLELDFVADLRRCTVVSEMQWRRRPVAERVLAALGTLLERQQ